MATTSGPETNLHRSSTLPWPGLLWFAGLLVVCYAPILVKLVDQWMNDDDMGHGFFVPLVAAYVAWQRREAILQTPVTVNWWGLAVVGWGALQCYLALLATELFLMRTAFIISLVGCILFLCGWQMLRALSFPLVLLVFMVPIPALIYNQVTFPLQLFASRVAEVGLNLVGIPVLREGNILELASQRLSVVEACSGIRSMLTLSFLALVYAHFFDEKPWMRWVLFAFTLPIAVATNAFRVMATGVVGEYDPALAAGFFHTVEGWIIFATALVCLVLTHRLINWLYRFRRERT